ncbi:unnamed protein product, partial [Pylaiella littoralis]
MSVSRGGVSWGRTYLAAADKERNLQFLETITQNTHTILSGSVGDGVSAAACCRMIEYAKGFDHVLGVEDADVILPAYEGPLKRHVFVDPTAKA